MDFYTAFFSLAGLYVAIVFTVVFYLVFNEWTRYQARLKGLKGPRGFPVIGNLYQVRILQSSMTLANL